MSIERQNVSKSKIILRLFNILNLFFKPLDPDPKHSASAHLGILQGVDDIVLLLLHLPLYQASGHLNLLAGAAEGYLQTNKNKVASSKCKNV